MLLKESIEKIKAEYDMGDIYWLETIENELSKYDLKNKQEIYCLLDILYKMNYVVEETQTQKVASKYFQETYDVYAEMKVDLTKMLGIEDMWEEI